MMRSQTSSSSTRRPRVAAADADIVVRGCRCDRASRPRSAARPRQSASRVTSASSAVARCRPRRRSRPRCRAARARSRSTQHHAGALAREQDGGGAAIADRVAGRLAGADDDGDLVAFSRHASGRHVRAPKPSSPASSCTPSVVQRHRDQVVLAHGEDRVHELLDAVAGRERRPGAVARRTRRGAARRRRGPASPRTDPSRRRRARPRCAGCRRR